MIFQQFNEHGITWKDYYSTLPTLGVFLPLLGGPAMRSGLAGIDQFYTDAAAGDPPRLSAWWSPTTTGSPRRTPRTSSSATSSSAKVVNAVMSGPKWSRPC